MFRILKRVSLGYRGRRRHFAQPRRLSLEAVEDRTPLSAFAGSCTGCEPQPVAERGVEHGSAGTTGDESAGTPPKIRPPHAVRGGHKPHFGPAFDRAEPLSRGLGASPAKLAGRVPPLVPALGDRGVGFWAGRAWKDLGSSDVLARHRRAGLRSNRHGAGKSARRGDGYHVAPLRGAQDKSVVMSHADLRRLNSLIAIRHGPTNGFSHRPKSQSGGFDHPRP
jgi:hypothetical protein